MSTELDDLFKEEAERLNKKLEEKFGPNPFLEIWRRNWLEPLKGSSYPQIDPETTPHETPSQTNP